MVGAVFLLACMSTSMVQVQCLPQAAGAQPDSSPRLGLWLRRTACIHAVSTMYYSSMYAWYASTLPAVKKLSVYHQLKSMC